MLVTKPTRCPYCHTPVVVTYSVVGGGILGAAWVVLGKFPVCPGPCQETMAQREREAARGLTTFE